MRILDDDCVILVENRVYPISLSNMRDRCITKLRTITPYLEAWRAAKERVCITRGISQYLYSLGEYNPSVFAATDLGSFDLEALEFLKHEKSILLYRLTSSHGILPSSSHTIEWSLSNFVKEKSYKPLNFNKEVVSWDYGKLLSQWDSMHEFLVTILEEKYLLEVSHEDTRR